MAFSNPILSNKMKTYLKEWQERSSISSNNSAMLFVQFGELCHRKNHKQQIRKIKQEKRQETLPLCLFCKRLTRSLSDCPSIQTLWTQKHIFAVRTQKQYAVEAGNGNKHERHKFIGLKPKENENK